MFTGIIEEIGQVVGVSKKQNNINLDLSCSFVNELKIDQSIAHNGICLTVVEKTRNSYTVTAIEETLKRSNLSEIKSGNWINLERCVKVNQRLDGHIVQGHVDTVGKVSSIEHCDGSWMVTIRHQPNQLTVEKGSIAVNGVSLTVVDSNLDSFSVALIPYTFEHTNFKYLSIGNTVNLEFDIIGKYVAKMMVT